MLRRICLAYVAVGKTFGIWLGSLITMFLLGCLWITVSLGLVLDQLFFPRLWRKRIRSPIVIVGNPRTGTTFLQRFLVENGVGVGMQLWRMLYPSLTMQIVLKPLLPFLEKMSPARYHRSAVHETGLGAVETDDAAILFRFFDGFFLYGFLLAWSERTYQREIDPEVRDTSVRDFRLFRAMWRRNLIANRGNRVVAKSFSLALRLPRFLQEFPDARLLYLVRDPVSAVPSTMGLVTSVLERRFGFWKLPVEMRERYLRKLYDALLELTRRFHRDYVSGLIPADRILFVHYDRILHDFDNLMHDILEFVRTQPDVRLCQAIKRTAEMQRVYVSSHEYELHTFGFENEQIREDYSFYYRTFLPP